DAGCAVFTGYHAPAGTVHATRDHTIAAGLVHNWWLNGGVVEETQIHAALAGYFVVAVALEAGTSGWRSR
ncbi:MAG: M55 family metallopeptidase, partial [Thermaerobacter sp.]|nr:M55 family metallopeptidase [Thermaerobacter sp.]